MALSSEDLERIEAFRNYIEDSVASDDRYGPASRHDPESQAWFASRFEAAPNCWFEVGVKPSPAQVHVAFLTSDTERAGIGRQTIEESGGGTEQYIAATFAELGIDWPDAHVEQASEGDLTRYTTVTALDDLDDLDSEQRRNQALSVLEGMLVAFAPALAVEEGAD